MGTAWYDGAWLSGGAGRSHYDGNVRPGPRVSSTKTTNKQTPLNVETKQLRISYDTLFFVTV